MEEALVGLQFFLKAREEEIDRLGKEFLLHDLLLGRIRLLDVKQNFCKRTLYFVMTIDNHTNVKCVQLISNQNVINSFLGN
jgi:hypothetical protein